MQEQDFTFRSHTDHTTSEPISASTPETGLPESKPVENMTPPEPMYIPPQNRWKTPLGVPTPQPASQTTWQSQQPDVPPMASSHETGENGAVPPHTPFSDLHSGYGVPPQVNWYQQPPQYGHMPMPPQMPPNTSQPLSPEKKDRRAAFWLKIASALVALLLLYCIGSDIYAYRHGISNAASVPTASDPTVEGDASEYVGAEVVIEQQDKPQLDPDAENVDETGRYTVEGVAAAVRPSIVEIYTYGDKDATYLSGTGSGIILSEDGYIITNAHVLTDGESFMVITDDETEYSAEVVGSDAKTDIAVIKINATGLPAATMGNSDDVVLGEAVVAIGNPAGLTGSITNGIVSGLNRLIRSDATGFDMNCIQTNAAISPGNSGGALVNMYGQVIGITSSKYVSSSYEGLGFAITINEVLPIVEDIIENGYVSGRVRVGITFVSLEYNETKVSFCEEIGAVLQPEDLRGVWVTEIAEDCDIANTKLAINDVIIAVEGEPVNNYDELSAAIEGKQADDTVKALCRRYDRDGTYDEFEISFKLMADTSGNY